MRFLRSTACTSRKANALKPDGATQELIRTQQGTIATDISTTTRTGTLLGFDVGESDWPLKASFVLFMRNLLEQARAHRAHGMTRPGARRRAAARDAPGDGDATSRRPGRAARRSRSRCAAASRSCPRSPRVGFYHLTWQGPQAGTIVVPANLTSEAESDLTAEAARKSEPARSTVTSAAQQPDAHVEWTLAARAGRARASSSSTSGT